MTLPETNTLSPEQRLDEIRRSGDDAVDPVRFRYLEALTRRLREKDLTGSPQWQRLTEHLEAYQDLCRRAGATAPHADALPTRVTTSRFTSLLEQINRDPEPYRPKAGGFLARLETALGTPADRGPGPAAVNTGPGTLRALVRAREDQSSQVLQKRIRAAIENTPKDAGPMNAHRLVSRAIREMQRISPDYLQRFAGYVDTLMVLERTGRKR